MSMLAPATIPSPEPVSTAPSLVLPPPVGGDHSLQRVMSIQYQSGSVDYRHSANGEQLNQWLAVASSRLTSSNYATGLQYLQAFVAKLAFDFVGVGPGEGHSHWTASNKAPLINFRQSIGSQGSVQSAE